MTLMTFALARPGILRLALIAAFMVLALAASPSAPASAGGEYAFAIGSSSGGPGGLQTVEVAAAAPDPGIGSFTLDIFYDESKVSVSSCRSPFAGCNKDFRPGQIRIAGVPFTPLTGDRLVATIIFQARTGAAGSSPLDIQATNIFSALGDDLISRTDITDGSLTIDPQAPTVKRGDANCDGEVNDRDGLAVLSHISSNDGGSCITFADYNCDGRVDAADAIAILQSLGDVDAAPSC